jgi:transcriptional regulator with GAF, ATPase, and Fis domain
MPLLMSAAADHFRSALDAATRLRAATEGLSPDAQARVQVALTDLLDAHRRAAAGAAAPAGDGDPTERARLLRLFAATQPDLAAPPEQHLRTALAALAEALPADTTAFAVLEPDGSIGRLVGHSASGDATDDDGVLRVSASVIRRVHATGDRLAVADPARQSAFAAQHSIVQSGLRSIVCVPVLTGGIVRGAVYADRRKAETPFGRDDLELLTAFVRQTGAALQAYDRLARLADEAERLRQPGREAGRLVGQSRTLHLLLEQVAAVADTDATVLIVGESGTGKELLARTVHDQSRRAQGPFVAVNCGAIPEALLESTLFGHKRGAFTGASTDERGLVAAAAGGTLFLDEIGDMPPPLQVKLLRVLQAGTYTPVGDAREHVADVRWIAATHRNLPEAIRQNAFREDLYYRLAVFDLRVPPLRERPEDVALLADHFVRRFASRFDRPARHLSAEALLALEAYAWPGNIRELENVVQRAVILAEGPTILPRHLPATVRPAPAGNGVSADSAAGYHETVRAFKRRLIERTLAEHAGSRTEAAASLGLNRTYLSRLLRQLDLQDEDVARGDGSSS